ncbi:MAG: hypothetical protein NTX73_13760 [Rhodobacterales bacterium]|nr:hypothetical protein [Rhodobacterales bacterium]
MARAPLSVTRPKDGSAAYRAPAKHFRALRAEAVMTAPGTAFLLGLTGLGTLVANIAERTGLLAPGAWLWIGGLGLVVTAGKVFLDFLDRSGDAALWRQLLKERFATEGETDPEITRLTDLVIDLRCRLAEAEDRADDSGRALVSDTLPALDVWIDGIARLASRLSELRYEGRFQAGLADTSRRRLAQIEAQQKSSRDPQLLRQLSETANGLRHQIDAADRFRRFAESGYLQLEHAVAAVGTVGSQLMLVMTRGQDMGGPEELGAQIGQEVASLEGLLQALDRVAATDSGEIPRPDLSLSLPASQLPVVDLANAPMPGASPTNTTYASSDFDPHDADRRLQ